MLGIKIGTEWLDLKPGTQLEMEQHNPFLQFDEVIGEYSLPIELPVTDKNLRLLNYAAMIQARIDVRGVDASAYYNGIQHSIGKLKIEKPSINLNNAKRGSISCYYLMGISSFYQDAKDQRLRWIDAGGERSFTHSGYTTSGASFWGHIHTVVNGAAGYGTSGYDYAFYTVLNEDFGTGLPEILNNVKYESGMVKFYDMSTFNKICPFPYLKYILIKAVEYCGWKIEGDILNDEQFCRITMINSLAIAYYGLTTVKFNLADALPDITIPEFLKALKNRFGWYYDFDRKNKIIRIKPLLAVAQQTIKNFTADASPLVIKKVNTEKKVYALKDAGGGGISFTGVTQQADVLTKASLPAASAAQANHVRLVVDENNYYCCQTTNAGTAWAWELFAEGNGSYVPDGANQNIISQSYLPKMFKSGVYTDFAVQWNEAGYWPGRMEMVDYEGAIVLCFYYGLRNSTVTGKPYPFASPHIYDGAGVQVGTWSLAFKAKKTDGTEIGIYDLNFKAFLDTLNAWEEFEVTLNLPLVEFLALHFSDIIAVKNVLMYVTTIKASLPYKNSVSIEAVRI